MKAMVVTLAAAGIAAAVSMPAHADGTSRANGVNNTAAVAHTDISARRYYRRYGYYGPRYRYWGPRYGYYRPYPYYYRPYYGPGVSLGFWGGPRFGVWF